MQKHTDQVSVIGQGSELWNEGLVVVARPSSMLLVMRVPQATTLYPQHSSLSHSGDIYNAPVQIPLLAQDVRLPVNPKRNLTGEGRSLNCCHNGI
ncbi:hypothetical protein VFPFJ_10360 [Purpureocillium lilacinum]|uniref:Uncharacterized protein n=1 Tax=Purpureocillium lilacinum TaxID=33203 RepID=A0A179GL02_PURLI|nr:hypothetical protein VFPFJ_10360 [Purpureocillium lilacinum]OAQ77993.1 hypothetical protein VFPFJ_10360 [Purpureocillium lilacinum]